MTKDAFRAKWLAHFAAGIPKKDINKYVVSTGNYLWHVFSWELLDKNSFLVGDAAKAAYNKLQKHDALYIDWFKDKKNKSISGETATADALDQMTEVYVVADDFSWTYIKTHEGMCGPYFMKL